MDDIKIDNTLIDNDPINNYETKIREKSERNINDYIGNSSPTNLIIFIIRWDWRIRF